MSEETNFSHNTSSQSIGQGDLQFLNYLRNEYQTLQPFSMSMDYISLIHQICTCINKRIEFNELNENKDYQFQFLINLEFLRRIRKFETKLFIVIMNRICQSLGEKIEFFNNKKLQLNSLIFINEIFSGAEIKQAYNWIENLIPPLFKLKLDEEGQISLLADLILRNFVKNFFVYQTVQTLFNYLLASGSDVSELCETLLNEFITNIPPEELAALHFNFLEDCVCYYTIDYEDPAYVIISKFFKDIVKKLNDNNSIGNNNLLKKFFDNLTEDNKKIFNDIMNLESKN